MRIEPPFMCYCNLDIQFVKGLFFEVPFLDRMMKGDRFGRLGFRASTLNIFTGQL